MHHGTCVMHVPWYMSGSLNRGGGENVPGIPGACATRDFAYLVRDPWTTSFVIWSLSSLHRFDWIVVHKKECMYILSRYVLDKENAIDIKKYFVAKKNYGIYRSGVLVTYELYGHFRYFQVFYYASAFRRRRHYVFGLSVRPSVRLSVRPSVRSLKYPLLTCTWVRWSTRPTMTDLRHVLPSVCPSVRLSVRRGFRAFSRERMGEWPEILHADVSWPSSELISLWPRSVDFYNFGTILT